MLKELYKAIRGDAAPTIVEVGGREYSDKALHPVHTPTPDTIQVKTLTALVDYLKTNVDSLDVSKLICHVEAPHTVSIQSALLGDFDDRKTFIRAELDQISLPFNRWIDAEAFNIALQACFVEPDDVLQATDRWLVLKYVSNIKTTAEAGISDNGVSQAVTIKKGIASVENSVLPNPVTLRPFRTFTEVEQPASRFVFRVRHEDEMEFMLVEADGGAWRGEAMKNVKAFMEKGAPGLNVIA